MKEVYYMKFLKIILLRSEIYHLIQYHSPHINVILFKHKYDLNYHNS